jgi:antitoxin MazE
MRTKIVKWGNSLGLRIPKSFAEEVQVSEGSAVDLGLENGQLVIRVIEAKPVTLEELLAGVTPENQHGEVDTGGSVGGEVW